jgi:AAA15 family ATPase/GTPase
MIINILNNGRILQNKNDLEFPDFTVITGENGSGKTQLLEYLHSYSSVMMQMLRADEKQPIYDNNENPLIDVAYSFPGLKNSEFPYIAGKSLIQQIKEEWEILKPIARSYTLIKDKKFQNEETELNELNQSIIEFVKNLSNNPSRFSTSDLKQIALHQLHQLKKISTKASRSIDELTYIDYLIFYDVPAQIFSASLDLLFHQFFLKQKYYPNLTRNVSAPWVVFNNILDKANFKYSAEYTPAENEEHPLPIKLIDKEINIINTTFESLSSGEKTIMALIFVLYHSSNSGKFPDVILFDEPDAHLHPSLTQLFLSVIQDVLVKEQNVKVILTTHSPSTIALAPNESIFRMDRALGYPVKEDKKNAIQNLSNGLETISIEEGSIGIEYTLKNIEKDILFTEGITDKITLEIAWKKIYGAREMPFFIQDSFSANFLGTLFNQGDESPDGIFIQFPNKKLIALFDFDQAGYPNWNRKKFSNIIESDPTKCLVRTNDKNGFLMLLPASNEEPMKSLVIKNNFDTFEDQSKLTIESLFLNIKEIREKFFIEENVAGGGKIYLFNGNKRKFTEKIKTLDSSNFSEFRPLFEQILQIIDKNF